MKTYVTILIGVLALFAVVFVGYKMTLSTKKEPTIQEPIVQVVTVEGEVKRVFEGDNILSYSFDMDETSTTTVSMDGALVKVTDQNGTLVTSMYMSYEGGRGYSANDYIMNVISPKVSVVNSTGTTTVGAYDWEGVESAQSEWFVTQVLNGEWLVVVEGKKTDHEKTISFLSSLDVE